MTVNFEQLKLQSPDWSHFKEQKQPIFRLKPSYLIDNELKNKYGRLKGIETTDIDLKDTFTLGHQHNILWKNEQNEVFMVLFQ